jgi:hypothetical protein
LFLAGRILKDDSLIRPSTSLLAIERASAVTSQSQLLIGREQLQENRGGDHVPYCTPPDAVEPALRRLD